MKGFCGCGCEQLTKIAERNHKQHGWIKGEPKKFIFGHHSRLANNPNWKGGEKISSYGYFLFKNGSHPRADFWGYIPKQVFIVEKVLGKFLPKKAIVHHFNGIKTDNQNKNLIVCEDRAYHNILHRREKALKECGHAHWRKCTLCKKYDSPKNLYIHKEMVRHKICHAKNEKKRIGQGGQNA